MLKARSRTAAFARRFERCKDWKTRCSSTFPPRSASSYSCSSSMCMYTGISSANVCPRRFFSMLALTGSQPGIRHIALSATSIRAEPSGYRLTMQLQRTASAGRAVDRSPRFARGISAPPGQGLTAPEGREDVSAMRDGIASVYQVEGGRGALRPKAPRSCYFLLLLQLVRAPCILQENPRRKHCQQT